jgi:hypothetical protein
VRAELDALTAALQELYNWIERGSLDGGQARSVNRLFLELSRILVPIGYAEGGSFDHDPALPRPPIPRLARANELAASARNQPDLLPFLQTELKRAANHVANAFYEAARAVRRVSADR